MMNAKNTNHCCSKPVINVAFLYARMYNGGIERVLQILTTELSQRPGYNVYCVVKEESDSDYPLGSDVHKIVIPDSWSKNIPAFQEKEHIDVIVNGGYGLLTTWCIKRLQNKSCKVVSIYHGWFYWMFFDAIGYNPNILKTLIASDVLCVLSKVDAKLRQLSGIKQSMYMPNPLTFDLDKITPSPLNSKNILFIARIDDGRVKRPKMVIQAFGEIIKKVPDAKLQMVGECPDGAKEELLQVAKELNIPEGSIEFPGFTLDVDKFYKNAAVFIVPSLFEGWAMALTEAKAYGLPNIVTKMEYLETTKNGTIVVGKDDVAGIASEAVKLLTDDEYRHQQGKLARESLEEFRTEYVIDKWEQLLHAVVDGKESTQKFIEEQPSVDEEYALRVAREEYDATKPYNDYTRTHPFTLFPLSEERKIKCDLYDLKLKAKKGNVNAFVWCMKYIKSKFKRMLAYFSWY